MIRAFIALELPAELLRRLRDVGNELSSLGLTGRASRLEAIHLTLHFLGNVQPAQVEALQQPLRELSDSSAPFAIQVAGLGVFPDLARPRVVWAGVRPSDPLNLLQKGIDNVLRALDFDIDDRPFRPHLTLYRLKSTRNRDNLVRYLSRRPEPPRFGEFDVREFHLFQSQLKPGGAQYSTLVSWSLKGSVSS